MKISYLDQTAEQVEIDQERLDQFLDDLGIAVWTRRRLEIRVCEHIPEAFGKSEAVDEEAGLLGTHAICESGEQIIHLATWHRPGAEQINATLLHEIRHVQQRTRVATFAEYHERWLAENMLPYHARPTEMDARAFAARYAPHLSFVRIKRASLLTRLVRLIRKGARHG